ncbi:MAG: signal peptidase II [Candidatus Gracilibacteria bacterium]|nr:signal peptidase II [Candidatus Gracilibacteria bacterium]
MPIFLLTVLFFGIDLISKYLLVEFLKNEEVQIVGDFLTIKIVKNPDLAFSIPFPHLAKIILSIVIIGVFVYFVYLERPLSKLKTLAVSMILGGGLANFLERLAFGEVVDFIDFSFYPSFNLADTFIVLGVGIYLWNDIKTKSIEKKPE